MLLFFSKRIPFIQRQIRYIVIDRFWKHMQQVAATIVAAAAVSTACVREDNVAAAASIPIWNVHVDGRHMWIR